MKFLQGNTADEIQKGMEAQEFKKFAFENTVSDDAVVRAVEELKAAAECFESARLIKQAEHTTNLMVCIAKKGKKKKSL